MLDRHDWCKTEGWIMSSDEQKTLKLLSLFFRHTAEEYDFNTVIVKNYKGYVKLYIKELQYDLFIKFSIVGKTFNYESILFDGEDDNVGEFVIREKIKFETDPYFSFINILDETLKRYSLILDENLVGGVIKAIGSSLYGKE